MSFSYQIFYLGIPYQTGFYFSVDSPLLFNLGKSISGLFWQINRGHQVRLSYFLYLSALGDFFFSSITLMTRVFYFRGVNVEQAKLLAIDCY